MRIDQYNRIDSVRVKARADYKCQSCGSDEAIQAHAPDGDHADWRKGIALCGNCHADEHPDMPRSLFLSKVHQPYWHNISARALGVECNCHARTIIRRAKHLGIASNCDLSDMDKERIKSYKSPTQGRPVKQLKTLIGRTPDPSTENLKCPRCNNFTLRKAGFHIARNSKGSRKQQIYKCNLCFFNTTKPIGGKNG